jgi:hypothetical protein
MILNKIHASLKWFFIGYWILKRGWISILAFFFALVYLKLCILFSGIVIAFSFQPFLFN